MNTTLSPNYCRLLRAGRRRFARGHGRRPVPSAGGCARLVAALRNPDIDFDLGSSYVAGGSTEVGWSLFRRLNSKAATVLGRFLTSARDPMAWMFALRRALFVENAAELNPIGYKIGLECIVKCGCRNIAEVPIRFRSRLHGESKLSVVEQWNYRGFTFRTQRRIGT